MTERRIVITKGDEQRAYPLSKERLSIGRDASNDIVLDDASVSRKHATLIFRFEAIYIENVSPTGPILKNKEAVEYAELSEKDVAEIGSYQVRWEFGEAEKSAPQAPASGSASSDGLSLSSDSPALEPAPDSSPGEEVPMEAAPDDMQAALMPSLELNSADAGDVGLAQDDSAVSPSDSTKILESNVKARLRVVKGEKSGREIHLDSGSTWTVGRSPNCHVQIENPKLSREHFRVVKINNTYRVQDLGSSAGTRLNGVNVSDAPLQPFDTLQAGPVELQFVVVDAALAHLASATQLPAPGNQPLNNENEKTNFAPLVPYGQAPQGGATNPYFAQAGTGSDRATPNTNTGIFRAAAESDDEKKNPFLKAKEWYLTQPKPRQIMMMALLGVLLGAGALMLMGPPQDEIPVAQTPAPNTPKRDPAALGKDRTQQGPVDDFAKLSPQKQAEVKDLYAQAERSLQEKDYKTAAESAKRVLDLVNPYKNTTDILDQAQSSLNEDRIGLIAKSLTTVKDAADENKEKLDILLSEGRKALSERRFADAAEYYQRALALDPTSDDASQGLGAAISNNPNAKVDVPKEQAEIDPNAEAIMSEKDTLAGFKEQLIVAKTVMNDGRFREAMPRLKELDTRLGALGERYESGRMPASIRDELSPTLRSLQSQAREALDVARSQMRVEYQTQLADAEQFTNNRQYVQAREIYDRIVRLEPDFDEPRALRQRLYAKILVEAKNVYQESLIYESIGDLSNALDGYQKTKDLLSNVRDPLAIEYYKKASGKLSQLQ